MKISRRELLTAGVISGAAMAAGLASGAQAGIEDTGLVGVKKSEPKKGAVLQIASQEGRIPGKDLPEKIAKMEKWDLDGLEVGGRGLEKRVTEIKSVLANSKIKMTAICAGFD